MVNGCRFLPNAFWEMPVLVQIHRLTYKTTLETRTLSPVRTENIANHIIVFAQSASKRSESENNLGRTV